MVKAYLIIDESGAKGYSKNTEKIEGEFGVMVGYLVPFDALSDLKYQSNQSFKKISNKDKIHITDLTKNQMHEAREILYANFQHLKACWFYNAIYVNGLNNAYKNFDDKELLHSELFKGIFFKAIACIYDTTKSKDIYIEVISDTIDKGVIKKFKESLSDIINIFTNKNLIKSSTGYDKSTNEIIHYTHTTTVKHDDSMVLFNSIKYDIKYEDTSITFIADILANSTNYYLKETIKEKLNIKLNSIEAIKYHPLSNLVYGCTKKDSDYTIDIMDLMYRRIYKT
ncbi:MAG TPA: hypothetical protein EYG85_06895 [Crocinitomix sp.]|nr:hypothetical protein [Crocinitomix sp.]